jgi:hypothetical protein
MEKDNQTNDPFADYARFIANAASTPLYNLKVEQYLELLDKEAQNWDLVPNKYKDSYLKHTLECKATSLYWNRLFSLAANLTDEIFVFKCKRWVTSFIQMGRGKEELEILKSTCTLSQWVTEFRLKEVLHTLEKKEADTLQIQEAIGIALAEEEADTAQACEHSKKKRYEFLSTPFVSPTQEEKNILTQGLLENEGNLLKCIPLHWDVQQVGLFLFKNPWIFNQSPEMEVFRKSPSLIKYNWDWKVKDGLGKLRLEE